MIDALLRRFKISIRIVITAVLFCLLLLLIFPLVRVSYQVSRQQMQSLSAEELSISTLLLDAANQVANAELRVVQALADRRANVLVSESGALADLDTVQERLGQAEGLVPGPVEDSDDAPGPFQGIYQFVAALRTAVADFDAALSSGDLDTAAQQAAQVHIAGDQARSQMFLVLDQRRQLADRQTNAALDRWNNLFAALNAVILGLFPLAILFALLVSRTITRPLSLIQEAVESFTRGNLNAVATYPGQSEIAELGRSINRLFTSLSQSSQEMRKEVEDRTVALARRAIQLQTAAQITRDAAAIPEMEGLLNRVANLVRERFDFYYVGIFLLDAEGRYAIMRAGSGEAGRMLRSRGFRLRVGDPNLVGQVTLSGEERIVVDVSADFTHQREPLLPLTRSEAVLPLKIGAGRVIGALDVQSAVINAFESETLSVLQILSDQLAVVIENSRLQTALTQAQREAGTLLQRYTQETWSGLAASQHLPGYRFDLIEVQPLSQQGADPQVTAALADPGVSAGRVEVVSLDGGGSLLRVPLVMYNQVVGVIGLEEEDSSRSWSDDEVRIMEALTTQISLALENARLLDEAQRRTTQLHLLQEVTATAAANTELGDLLDNVTPILRAGLDLDFVGAAIFDQRIPGFSMEKVRFAAPRSADSPFTQLETLTWDVHTVPAVHRLVESGRNVLLEVQGGARVLGAAAFMLEQVGVTHVLLQPILYRGQVIGLLDLHTSASEAVFGEETLNLMDQVTLQLSSAVEVALSFAQTTLRAARERQMANVVQRIRETLDIPTILRTAAQEIRGSLVSGGREGAATDRQTEVVVRLGAFAEPAPLEDAPKPSTNGSGQGAVESE